MEQGAHRDRRGGRMSNPLNRIRITVEIQCDECHGEGDLPDPDGQNPNENTCSFCDGTGYAEMKMPLLHLKNLLDGGTL